MWSRSTLRFLNGIYSSSEDVLASRTLHHEKGGSALIQGSIWGRVTCGLFCLRRDSDKREGSS